MHTVLFVCLFSRINTMGYFLIVYQYKHYNSIRYVTFVVDLSLHLDVFTVTVDNFNIHRVRKKRGHVIFNYNSRISWSISIIFIPLETGRNEHSTVTCNLVT